MPATCLHGLPPAECLICKTLGVEAGAGTGAVAGRPDAADHGARGRPRSAPVPARGSPPMGVPGAVPAAPEPRRHPGLTHVVAVLAVIAVLAVAAWLLIGAVYAVIHVLELLAVAAVAGWAGYRVGRYRGRRGG